MPLQNDNGVQQRPEPQHITEPLITRPGEKPPPTSPFGGLDMSMLMQFLPLLQGGNNGEMMGTIVKMLSEKNVKKDGGKGGGLDMMAMLPLLMNSGLFSPAIKKENLHNNDRIIDLADYRQI